MGEAKSVEMMKQTEVYGSRLTAIEKPFKVSVAKYITVTRHHFAQKYVKD